MAERPLPASPSRPRFAARIAPTSAPSAWRDLARRLTGTSVLLALGTMGLVGGCGDNLPAAQATGSGGMGGGGAGAGGAGGAGGTTVVTAALRGTPMVFAPTTHGFSVSVVLATGEPATLRAQVRPHGAAAFDAAMAPSARAVDLAEWTFDGLDPGTAYDYRITTQAWSADIEIGQGTITTQRPAGAPFTFALVSDTHIGSDLTFSNQGEPTWLASASAAIAATKVDFVVNLGDVLDFHEYGFVQPPPTGAITRDAYLNYRDIFGTTLANAAHFITIGGWDAENGCDTLDEINRSRDQRLLYVPGPDATTYPEGGSTNEDYYAFTWGDALFVVLNVFTYTPTCHLLSADPGLPDDWTLGQAQLAWLQTTLASSTAKWKFLLIHHPVGGNAGNDIDSAYGRGGGRAANVGEQAIVHAMMRQFGAQVLFYGHDHVFTDMTVDDIHYSSPGSAGAIWFFPKEQTGYTQDWEVPGWGRVTVGPDSVHVEYIDLNRTVLYDYTLN